MLTRCPTCATTFRITPEQLKARQGRVRCGHCQGVFNAIETLVDSSAATVAPAPAAPPLAAPAHRALEASPGGLGAPQANAVVATSPSKVVAALDVPPADSGPALPPPAVANNAVSPAPSIELPAEVSPEAPRVAADPVVESGEPAGFRDAGEPRERSQSLQSGAADDSHASADSGAAASIAPAASLVPAAQPSPYSDPGPATVPAPLASTSPVVAPGSDEPETLVDYAPSFDSLMAEAPRRRAWPWVLGSLVALAALALQLSYQFRTELLIATPAAEPALRTLCDIAACDLPLPRKIDLIAIEASDLNPDPSQPARLQLVATLKNRAAYAQAFPHLELTLTDAADKALLRRALGPAEYLASSAAIASGFPGNGELAVNLALEVRDIVPIGYRLYVFYP